MTLETIALPAPAPAQLSVDVAAVDNLEDAPLEELVQRVAQGSCEAFSSLYRRVSSRVFGLVIRLLRDRSQSEEVTQEVFLDIWQHASHFDATRGSALSWVLTISRGRAVDCIRSAQRSHERDYQVGMRDRDVDFDSVSELAEISIENDRVRRAMTRLTYLQREAVTLAYYCGYSPTEVAMSLRIPPSTVRTRLRDGITRLRVELAVSSQALTTVTSAIP